MNRDSRAGRTHSPTRPAPGHGASGDGARSLQPPGYGIDFVDAGMSTAPVQRVEDEELEGDAVEEVGLEEEEEEVVQEKSAPAASVVQRFPVHVEARGAAHNRRGGTSMTARVGAESEWIYGSRPPGGVPNLMTRVGAEMQGTKRYVAGHLLNDNMGGLGRNDNLTVLSSDANKEHRGVEGKVKNLAQKADLINKGNKKFGNHAYDHGARYTVQVNAPAPDGTHPYAAQERHIGAGLTVDIEPIRFHKATGVESAWPEETGGVNDLAGHVVPNVPPYPAAPKKKKPTRVQRLVVLAIVKLADVTGSDLKSINGYIQANAANPPRRAFVASALKKGSAARFFSKRQGRYKVIARNLV